MNYYMLRCEVCGNIVVDSISEEELIKLGKYIQCQWCGSITKNGIFDELEK